MRRTPFARFAVSCALAAPMFLAACGMSPGGGGDGGGGGGGGPLPVTIATDTLPTAGINVPYTTSLGTQGGQAPFTWSLDSGTLPPGLTLGASGTISGT